MTIRTDIATLSTTAENIKTAITDQGQTVETTDSWADLPEKIDAIDSSGKTYTDALVKGVIEGTITYIYDDGSLNYIRPNCFQYCTKLETAEFTAITKICDYAFSCCFRLKTLILSGDFVRLDAITAFNYTPIGELNGNIYVTDDLVETYQNDSTWSNFSSIISALSNYRS